MHTECTLNLKVRIWRNMYIRKLLDQLGSTQQSPTPVYEDNMTCIEWGNNIMGRRERAKHIDIRKHFAHEVIPEW